MESFSFLFVFVFIYIVFGEALGMGRLFQHRLIDEKTKLHISFFCLEWLVSAGSRFNGRYIKRFVFRCFMQCLSRLSHRGWLVCRSYSMCWYFRLCELVFCFVLLVFSVKRTRRKRWEKSFRRKWISECCCVSNALAGLRFGNGGEGEEPFAEVLDSGSGVPVWWWDEHGLA